MSTELQLALVGGAVEGSPSPAMHRAALAAIGRHGDYWAVSVDGEGLARCLDTLAARGVRGVNVTIPHKQTALALAGRLSAGAAAASAVNTLCAESGGWTGHNTDATGLARLLAHHPLDGAAVVVLGAGGMARAALVALRERCGHLTVINRDLDRAAGMVAELRARSADGGATDVAVTVVAASDLAGVTAALAPATVLINATSVGMHDAAASPLPSQLGLGAVRLICDAVYTPRRTALLRRGESAGATVVDGLGLLAAQAADSFELWTGERVPDAVFRAAALTVPSA